MRRGFTLIELSLSLVFVGTLSIMMIVIIQNTVSSYQRGMTLNKINTAGMDLVDDFRSAVQNSSSDAVTSLCVDYYPEGSAGRQACIEDEADSFVRITKYARVILSDGTVREQMPVSGAFCTGSYSYIWNSGYFWDDEESNVVANGAGQVREVVGAKPAVLRYSTRDDNNRVVVRTVGNENWPNGEGENDADSGKAFRLLKVRDDTRAVCVAAMRQVVDVKYGSGYGSSNYMNYETLEANRNLMTNVFDISQDGLYSYSLQDSSELPMEVLAKDSNNDLVLYDLYTSRPAISSTRNNMFYAVSFIVGTVRGGIDIAGTGQNCTPPAEYDKEDFDYCAINKFNFAVQASGDITR